MHVPVRWQWWLSSLLILDRDLRVRLPVPAQRYERWCYPGFNVHMNENEPLLINACQEVLQ